MEVEYNYVKGQGWVPEALTCEVFNYIFEHKGTSYSATVYKRPPEEGENFIYTYRSEWDDMSRLVPERDDWYEQPQGGYVLGKVASYGYSEQDCLVTVVTRRV